MIILHFKTKFKTMKNLLFLLVVFGTLIISSCGDNVVQPVASQTDGEIQGVSYPTVQIITNGVLQTYKYESITYEDHFLEIQLADCQGGGCGVSIEFNSITYFKTFK